MKERLDIILVNQGHAQSREKAKAIIMAGNVYVNGQKEDKAGTMFSEEVNIEVHGNMLRYVSRGGLKLEKALQQFPISLEGSICMDIGASTGGFTDCMLQNGARPSGALMVKCSDDSNSNFLTDEQFEQLLASFVLVANMELIDDVPAPTKKSELNLENQNEFYQFWTSLVVQ